MAARRPHVVSGVPIPVDVQAKHDLFTEINAAIRKFETAQPRLRVARLNILRYADRAETLHGVEIVTREFK